MWKLSTIVNNMLAARKQGDMITAKIWQDRLAEVQSVY